MMMNWDEIEDLAGLDAPAIHLSSGIFRFDFASASMSPANIDQLIMDMHEPITVFPGHLVDEQQRIRSHLMMALTCLDVPDPLAQHSIDCLVAGLSTSSRERNSSKNNTVEIPTHDSAFKKVIGQSALSVLTSKDPESQSVCEIDYASVEEIEPPVRHFDEDLEKATRAKLQRNSFSMSSSLQDIHEEDRIPMPNIKKFFPQSNLEEIRIPKSLQNIQQGPISSLLDVQSPSSSSSTLLARLRRRSICKQDEEALHNLPSHITKQVLKYKWKVMRWIRKQLKIKEKKSGHFVRTRSHAVAEALNMQSELDWARLWMNRKKDLFAEKLLDNISIRQLVHDYVSEDN